MKVFILYNIFHIFVTFDQCAAQVIQCDIKTCTRKTFCFHYAKKKNVKTLQFPRLYAVAHRQTFELLPHPSSLFNVHASIIIMFDIFELVYQWFISEIQFNVNWNIIHIDIYCIWLHAYHIPLLISVSNIKFTREAEAIALVLQTLSLLTEHIVMRPTQSLRTFQDVTLCALFI